MIKWTLGGGLSFTVLPSAQVWLSFSERLAGSVGLVTAGCQNPQSHALTDRCSHTHTRPPRAWHTAKYLSTVL